MHTPNHAKARPLTRNPVAVGEYAPENAFGALAPSDYQAAMDSQLAYQEGIFHAAAPSLDRFIEQLHNAID